MTRILFYAILPLLFLFPAFLPAAWQDGNEWLEIPGEYKKEITEKLEKSKQFTTDQLSVITDCLHESSVSEVLNCLSAGGIDEAAGILVLIRDEVGAIRERICGSSVLGNKDHCDQLGDTLVRLKEDLQEAWSVTIDKGKQYLAEKNRLLTMKRKICNQIKQKGCYKWLNDRIALKCNPQKIGSDPATIEKCQRGVADEVWQRLGNRD
jgi:hypothetical protein